VVVFVYRVALVAIDGDADADLLRVLAREGVSCEVVSILDGLAAGVDAALFDLSASGREHLIHAADRCRQLDLPLLCALPIDLVSQYDASWGATDFFVSPPHRGEVSARIGLLCKTAGDTGSTGERVIQVGDLRIDQDRYEVFNRGRKVLLTFKEYQLLCLLAANPGRVFSRDALLEQIWEYDYFGGTRTVDVHIRRLRSKIEGPGRTYIETVWSVGYRFRPQD
jgi:DNA-binding response OmpR family regulator